MSQEISHKNNIIMNEKFQQCSKSFSANTSNRNRNAVFLPPKSDWAKIEESYGWFSIRPEILQRFASPKWVLFWLCWATVLQGLIVNGFVNVVITTIEKRYHLSSTQSGLIVGAYDIAGLIFLIPVSYFGESRSKPRFIATGVMLLAFGSIIFALPYLTAGPYDFTDTEETHLCPASGSQSSLICQSTNRENLKSLSISNYLYVFLFAMLLNGAGSSPFYTLGCTYIDENVSTATSSLYIGIYYTMAILGPAIGYILGGQLLRIYVDLGVDTHKLGLTPSSSVWVGAWWIGFFFSGIMCLIMIVPISGLPKKLPGADEINAKKVIETHKNVESTEAVRPGFGVKLKDMPVSLRILIKNGPFMLLSLAGASDSMIIAGLAAFAPKIAELQFGLSASSAALIVGIVALSAAGGGNFLGSYIVKRFNMNYNTIIKMCIALSLTSLCFTSGFALSCPNGQFAGLNVHYNNSDHQLSEVNFESQCNSQCSCFNSQYDPICGANGVQYYSPCHAGCKQSNETDVITTYSQCGCIHLLANNSSVPNTGTMVPDAERRRCTSNCDLLPSFLALQFFLIFTTFLVSMPELSATLRCVAKSQKSFSLGVQWVMIRLLGSIPAPILFGQLIDLSCTLWQSSCHNNNRGACLFYNNTLMSQYILILVIVAKVVTCSSIIGSWILYKPPNGSASVIPCNTTINNEINIIVNVNNGNNLLNQQINGSLREISDSEGNCDSSNL